MWKSFWRLKEEEKGPKLSLTGTKLVVLRRRCTGFFFDHFCFFGNRIMSSDQAFGLRFARTTNIKSGGKHGVFPQNIKINTSINKVKNVFCTN
jgi:hypothetical protein